MSKSGKIKGSVRLRMARRVLVKMPDTFTSRQFCDKWIDMLGGRQCPLIGGARSLCIKMGCVKTPAVGNGYETWTKPNNKVTEIAIFRNENYLDNTATR